MCVFQGTAKSDKALKLPQLCFGENTEMHHSVLDHRFLLDLTALKFDCKSLVPVNCFKTIDQSHETENKIMFIFCADTNTVRLYVNAIIATVK